MGKSVMSKFSEVQNGKPKWKIISWEIKYPNSCKEYDDVYFKVVKV